MADEQQNKLSHDDIKALMHNPDAQTKVRVIEKLSQQYNNEDFTDAQIQLAEQIFRLLLKQAEIEVRKALAENLMSSVVAPHDVVLSLAKDVEEVALPVLEFSEVLSDEDLVQIIASSEKVSSQVAIANRRQVSENISSALVQTHNEDVVSNLFNNDGARISEESYTEAVDTFADSEHIVESLVTRGELPKNVIEQMTNKVSAEIQKKLEKKYEHSFESINNVFKESGKLAAARFLQFPKIDKRLIEIIGKLEESEELDNLLHPSHGALTHLLNGVEQLSAFSPLAALTTGSMTFFAITLARFTGVPIANVRKLASDPKIGLKALYERAQLPSKMFDATVFVIGIISLMDQEHEEKGTPKAKDAPHLMAKHILQQSKGRRIPNLSHFVSMIRRYIETPQSEW